MDPYSRKRKYSSLLIIIVAAFLIHGSVLDRFWLGDDPQVLLHAVRYSPVEVVSERPAWQELSTSNFTPLVTWSFDMDLSLFGPNPQLFYLHQIFSIALAALCLRLLMLALGAGERSSLLLALLFLAAPPTVHVAGLLMTRHYVEGLVAAAVSVLLWVIAIRRPEHQTILIIGSVCAYLVSLLAKEVFVLLPLVYIALAVGRTTRRRLILMMIPSGIAAAGYLAWRSWMLESPGGYGGGNVAMHLLDLTLQWVRAHPSVALWFAVSIGVCMISWLRSRLDVFRFGLIGAAATGPLAGIGDSLEGRHLLVPAAVVLCGAVGGATVRLKGNVKNGLLAVLALLTVVAAAFQMSSEARQIERMEAEGRYVWEERRDAKKLLAGSPGWYLDGIAELDLIWRGESSPDVVFSETGVLLSAGSDSYISFADDASPRVVDLRGADAARRTYDARASIDLEIVRTGHELQWRFAPECDCEWYFYSYPGYQRFEVPRQGSRIVPRPREQQWFRIERRERSGRWTLSPPLSLPRDGEKTRWKREP